jgi:hypothetical protein
VTGLRRGGTLVVATVATLVLLPGLSGAQNGPAFSPSDYALLFNFVNPGQTSPPKRLTVRNTGGSSLTIHRLDVSGYHVRDFEVVSDSCVGATLQPGETCTTDVVFKPSASGTRHSNLRYADNTPCPNWIVLAGSGERTQSGAQARAATCGGLTQSQVVAAESRAVIALPTPRRRCASRRVFTIRLKRRRGVRFTEVVVTLNGRRFRTQRGRNLKARVDLRGLPRGRFRLRVRIKTNTGRVLRRSRYYVTCTKRRHATK